MRGTADRCLRLLCCAGLLLDESQANGGCLVWLGENHKIHIHSIPGVHLKQHQSTSRIRAPLAPFHELKTLPNALVP
jgi:hypothetical protein